MEPEGSLPHSQMSNTCPYPEQARSNPYPHIPLSEESSSYYPPIYVLVSQVASFPQVSSPKSCIRLSSPPYMLHVSPISFFSILLPEKFWVRINDHKAPHYVVFSTLLSPRLSQTQVLSSMPYSQTSSAYVPPSVWATKYHTHSKNGYVYSFVYLNLSIFG